MHGTVRTLDRDNSLAALPRLRSVTMKGQTRPRINGGSLMSSRIKITLPDQIAERLDELAAAEGEPVARVTARMVREGAAKLAAAGGDTRVMAVQSPARPPWLEPYGGSREWRQRMWGAIVALYGRYPDELKGLQQGWWKDT